MAISRLRCWDFSELVTTMPEGMWVIRTAESVVFTCCPPAPLARIVSMRMSVAGMSISTASASGRTATVAAEVWMRPPDSVSGTRCTRCTPLSYLRRAKTPSPAIRAVTSLMPPSSVSCRSMISTCQPFASA
jgi:hypothetical protein